MSADGAGSPSRALPASQAAVGEQVPPRQSRPRRSSTILLQVLAGLGILALWELAVTTRVMNPVLFGEPVAVARRIVALLAGDTIYSRTIYDHLATSLQVIVVGYAAGAAAGILLGFVFGRSRPLARIFEPFILAVASVPKIAIAPLFVVVLGIGIAAKLSIVFVEVFFLVFFNTMRGVFEVHEEYVSLARIMGASRWRILRQVVIPAALPDIMLGLRMGVPFAMTGVVLAEFISSNQGIGWLILYSSTSLDANGLWAALLFLVATTWVLTLVIGLLERRFLAWQPSRQAGSMQV